MLQLFQEVDGFNPESIFLNSLHNAAIDSVRANYSESNGLASQVLFVNHSPANYTPTLMHSNTLTHTQGRDLEVGNERLDDVTRKVSELLEKWDNRLRFPFSGLPERYLRGDLAPVLNIRWNGGLDDSGNDFMRVMYTHSLIQNVCSDIEIEGVNDNDEFAVLVDSVQVVNEPEWIPAGVRSRVRLQFPNAPQGRLAFNSLYFSLIFTRFVFLRIAGGIIVEDGKLDARRIISPVFGGRQLPRDMIERGPKMVDDFTSSDFPLGIDRSVSDRLLDFLKCFPIMIGPNWIFPLEINRGERVDETVDCPFQVTDVLVGPF